MDLTLPDGDGCELCVRLRRAGVRVPVVMLTAHGSERVAVAAIKAGAFDYLPKPFDPDELVLAVRRAADTRDLRLQNARLRTEAALGRTIVAESPAMKRLMLRRNMPRAKRWRRPSTPPLPMRRRRGIRRCRCTTRPRIRPRRRCIMRKSRRLKAKEGCSFLKKRTKKLLPRCVGCRRAPHQQSKVFCFFFSKKKTFLLPFGPMHAAPDLARNPPLPA